MLAREDFEGIGRVVEKKIQELVPPMIKTGVKSGIDGLEARIDLKFDAVQEQLDELRADVRGLRTGIDGLRTDVDG